MTLQIMSSNFDENSLQIMTQTDPSNLEQYEQAGKLNSLDCLHSSTVYCSEGREGAREGHRQN